MPAPVPPVFCPGTSAEVGAHVGHLVAGRCRADSRVAIAEATGAAGGVVGLEVKPAGLAPGYGDKTHGRGRGPQWHRGPVPVVPRDAPPASIRSDPTRFPLQIPPQGAVFRGWGRSDAPQQQRCLLCTDPKPQHRPQPGKGPRSHSHPGTRVLTCCRGAPPPSPCRRSVPCWGRRCPRCQRGRRRRVWMG